MVEKNREIKTQIPITDKDSQEIIIDIVMEGKSAYDVAVERGFDGTLEEWLLSLQGEKGDKGDKGEKGDKGDKGDPADVDDIQAQVDTVGSEVILARGTEPTLGARLDSTDAQLNHMTQDFTQHKLDYVAHKEDYANLKNKADFIELSSNLFNPMDVTAGYSISATTGELVTNTPYNVSDFIEVKSLQPYVTQLVGRWAQYDKNKNFISSNTTASFTTNANTSYIRVAVANASLFKAQVNLGNILLPFDVYKRVLQRDNNGVVIIPTPKSVTIEAMKNDSVSPWNVLSFKKPNNLFNKNNVIMDKTLGTPYGKILDDSSFVLANEYIKVKPNQTYSKGNIIVTVGYYNLDKAFIESKIIIGTTPTFITPQGCEYIRVSPKKSSYETFMLNEGEILLPYEDYAFELQSTNQFPIKINDSLLLPTETPIESNEPIIRPFRSINYTKGDYSSIVASLDSTGCVVENLGLCSDGINSVYGLAFGDTANKPVTFLIGNQHGSEWIGLHYALDFMKIISGVNKFYDADLLKTLTDNFAFYLIVSANPWGYINNSYVNYNGVNLNKNWDNNWELIDTGEGTQYKGTAPFSEPETQIIRNKFLTLQPYMMIDCHTTGETPGGMDTGKKYITYRELLFNCYNQTAKIFDDAMLSVQEWNTGSGANSVGWSGKQKSKEGIACIPALIEQPTYYNGNYGLTALFMLSLYARNYYLKS